MSQMERFKELIEESKNIVFFEFYRQKMDVRTIQPNAAHIALVELERQGKLKAIITQNIDGLHLSFYGTTYGSNQ